jgi:hypothetical protein
MSPNVTVLSTVRKMWGGKETFIELLTDRCDAGYTFAQSICTRNCKYGDEILECLKFLESEDPILLTPDGPSLLELVDQHCPHPDLRTYLTDVFSATSGDSEDLVKQKYEDCKSSTCSLDGDISRTLLDVGKEFIKQDDAKGLKSLIHLNPDIILIQHERNGCTFAHLAVIHSAIECFKLVIAECPDLVNYRCNGLTVFDLLLTQKSSETCALMLHYTQRAISISKS